LVMMDLGVLQSHTVATIICLELGCCCISTCKVSRKAILPGFARDGLRHWCGLRHRHVQWLIDVSFIFTELEVRVRLQLLYVHFWKRLLEK